MYQTCVVTCKESRSTLEWNVDLMDVISLHEMTSQQNWLPQRSKRSTLHYYFIVGNAAVTLHQLMSLWKKFELLHCSIAILVPLFLTLSTQQQVRRALCLCVFRHRLTNTVPVLEPGQFICWPIWVFDRHNGVSIYVCRFANIHLTAYTKPQSCVFMLKFSVKKKHIFLILHIWLYFCFLFMYSFLHDSLLLNGQIPSLNYINVNVRFW